MWRYVTEDQLTVRWQVSQGKVVTKCVCGLPIAAVPL